MLQSKFASACLLKFFLFQHYQASSKYAKKKGVCAGESSSLSLVQIPPRPPNQFCNQSNHVLPAAPAAAALAAACLLVFYKKHKQSLVKKV